MKVAISALDAKMESQIDPRFGRAQNIIIIDTKNPDSFSVFNNSANLQAAQGAGIQAAQKMAELGVGAVVSGHVGPKAYNVLKAAGIAIFSCGEGAVSEVFARYQRGELEELIDHTCTGVKQC